MESSAKRLKENKDGVGDLRSTGKNTSISQSGPDSNPDFTPTELLFIYLFIYLFILESDPLFLKWEHTHIESWM